VVWRTHFIKSVEGKEKNDHGFLEDPSHEFHDDVCVAIVVVQVLA